MRFFTVVYACLLSCAFQVFAHMTPLLVDEVEIYSSSVELYEFQVVKNAAGEAVAMWIEKGCFTTRLMSAARCKTGQWTGAVIVQEGRDLSAPSLAMNAEGNSVAVWQNGAQVVSSFSSIGKTWSFPAVVSSGGRPGVAVNETNRCTLLFLQDHTVVSAQAFFDAPWSPAKSVSTSAALCDHPKLFMNHSGRALALWQENEGYGTSLSCASSQDGSVWSLPHRLSSANEIVSEPTATLNEKGDALVAWRSSSSKGLVIKTAQAKNLHSREAPITLSTDAENSLHPQVTLNEEGKGVVTWVAQHHGTREIIVCPGRRSLYSLQRECPWVVQVRASAYLPVNERMRVIYGDVYPSAGFLLGYALCDRFALIGTVDYLSKTGHSQGKRDSTKLELIPISALLRYSLFPFFWCACYVGAGPRYTIAKTRQSLRVVDRHVKEEGLGVVGEAGVTFFLGSRFTADLFINYSYCTISGPSNKVYIEGGTIDVGGLQAGIALGLRF